MQHMHMHKVMIRHDEAKKLPSLEGNLPGVEFHRKLRESIWILLWSLKESLDSSAFSLCETFGSLEESNWILAD